MILLHDNAHVTKLVKKTLEALRREVLSHATYSSDCPFRLSLVSIDGTLAEEYFNSYEDVEKWVSEWIASKMSHSFAAEFAYCP